MDFFVQCGTHGSMEARSRPEVTIPVGVSLIAL